MIIGFRDTTTVRVHAPSRHIAALTMAFEEEIVNEENQSE